MPQHSAGALCVPDCFISSCFFAVLRPKYPKNLPARFARRIASFTYAFCSFNAQMLQKMPARFARRIASFPHAFCCFKAQIPQNLAGALRAGARTQQNLLNGHDFSKHLAFSGGNVVTNMLASDCCPHGPKFWTGFWACHFDPPYAKIEPLLENLAVRTCASRAGVLGASQDTCMKNVSQMHIH